MFTKLGRRALTASATAITAGAVLIPAAAADDGGSNFDIVTSIWYGSAYALEFIYQLGLGPVLELLSTGR
ncbi:hypothetical protein FRX94_04390 [Corynebacterium canis]|uniref:Uncharacterized protein n=1 Tax=Corynebacterium canis TaxID=679663 RepID=A0A5C5ULD6_9CORY|nr:hypothetical protein [Corynebacterium canis]TWT26846.1 hypothetical protein FRX94_04390 [Corynebacterium canis]WJY74437.1 hypothetical protein CCANI_02900 [Corynebacterium canis]